MDRASRVRVAGPLAPHAARFKEHLAALEYSPASAGAHLCLMAQLSRWLVDTGLDLAGLTSERLEEFLTANRAKGRRFPKSSRGAELLISFLRINNVIPAPTAVVLSPSEQMIERLASYLESERGLCPGTIVNHVHAARLFLKGLEPAVAADLERLEASHVHRFVLTESQRRGVASTKCLVTGLRSLLRFLHAEGITTGSLAGAVPTVSGSSGTWLPRAAPVGRGSAGQLRPNQLAGLSRLRRAHNAVPPRDTRR